MSVVGGEVPQAKQEINDCIFDRKICSSPNEINLMRKFLTELSIQVPKSDREVVEILKKELKVANESQIWESRQFKEFVGSSTADTILKKIFKPIGPSNSTALLDNFNIDETMEQWSLNGKDLFGKKFYHIPYQMIDFALVQSKLARTTLWDMIHRNYDCFGVVLNTDISSGRGKHWFCLYGDFKHAGTKEDPYTLEYFNSSGNPPMNEVEIWLQKSVHDLLRDHKKYCEIVRSAPQRLQYSGTECGVWSLLYIYSRLQNHAPNWFYKVRADDNDMIKMRAQFFRK